MISPAVASLELPVDNKTEPDISAADEPEPTVTLPEPETVPAAEVTDTSPLGREIPEPLSMFTRPPCVKPSPACISILPPTEAAPALRRKGPPSPAEVSVTEPADIRTAPPVVEGVLSPTESPACKRRSDPETEVDDPTDTSTVPAEEALSPDLI